ncbi:hypothetical protein AOLI_G00170740 [Acnodon oligacanthus]
MCRALGDYRQLKDGATGGTSPVILLSLNKHEERRSCSRQQHTYKHTLRPVAAPPVRCDNFAPPASSF